MSYCNNSAAAQSIRAQAAIILVAFSVLISGSVTVQAQTTSSTAASDAAASEASLSYTVRLKDKLIALTVELLNNPKDWPEVARFNRLKNANQINPGQVINNPTRLVKSEPAAVEVISTFGDVQLAGQPVAVDMAVSEGARLQTAINNMAVVDLLPAPSLAAHCRAIS
jgi:hypothetical protein